MSLTTKQTEAILDKLSEQQQKEYIGRVLETLISANHTVFKIEQFQHHPAWLKETKNYGNHFLKRLIKIEKDFDVIANNNENMDALYDDFHDFMEEVNSITLPEMKRFTAILKAAKKSPESLTGIAKKVLKDS